MKKYITKRSSIKGAGKGLFTKAAYKKGEVIGLAHVNDQPTTEIGRNHNHNEENPTAYNEKINNKRYLYASRDLKPNEEITTNYRLQPELEQPEDFMRKGGLVKMPKPSKKGLLSKSYSRSLDATNRLFTENRLFEKPKSRKNKVFDPHAKYYAEGGSYEEAELTPEEIEAYRAEGYTIDDTEYKEGGNTKTKLSDKEEKTFQKFYNTLPDNLQSDDDTYDIRGYWDSEGRPEEFNYDQPKEDDGYYHAYSINGNTGEYLKSPAHETFQHAVDEDRKMGYRPITNVQGRNIAIENESLIEPEAQSFLRNRTGPAYSNGGDISVPSLNQMQDGGTYTYAGRKDSTYKKDANGKWLIKNASTGNKFTAISDPKGTRTKTLNAQAKPISSTPKAIEKVYASPTESTDTPNVRERALLDAPYKMNQYIKDVNNKHGVVSNYKNNIYNNPAFTTKDKEKYLNKLKGKNLNEQAKISENYLINLATVKANQGTVKGVPKKSASDYIERGWDMLTNPFDAFHYSVATGDVNNMPWHYNEAKRRGINPSESLRGGTEISEIANTPNPFDAGDKVAWNTGQGNFGTALLHATRFLPYTTVGLGANMLGSLNRFGNVIESAANYKPLLNLTKNSNFLGQAIGESANATNVLRSANIAQSMSLTPDIISDANDYINSGGRKTEQGSRALKNTGRALLYGTSALATRPGSYGSLINQTVAPYKAPYNIYNDIYNVYHKKPNRMGSIPLDMFGAARSLANLRGARKLGGEQKSIEANVTDEDIQDLIDQGFVVEEVNTYDEGGDINTEMMDVESPQDLDPVHMKKYLSDLRYLENGIKKGYRNGKWYPHSSVEGGTKTIAYGHKLANNSQYGSGLTEQDALALQEQDVLKHQAEAKRLTDAKYGEGTFDKLPQKNQMLLVDYAYNGVYSKFPSFVKSVVTNNKQGMLNNYKRYSGNNPIKSRNEWTANVINEEEKINKAVDKSKKSDNDFINSIIPSLYTETKPKSKPQSKKVYNFMTGKYQ